MRWSVNIQLSSSVSALCSIPLVHKHLNLLVWFNPNQVNRRSEVQWHFPYKVIEYYLCRLTAAAQKVSVTAGTKLWKLFCQSWLILTHDLSHKIGSPCLHLQLNKPLNWWWDAITPLIHLCLLSYVLEFKSRVDLFHNLNDLFDLNLIKL